MSVSLHRLRPGRRSNEAMDEPLTVEERGVMIAAAARKLEELLDVLRVDHQSDHNTRDTPARVARMLVNETLAGRFAPPPTITAFENAEQYASLLVTGPITVRSTCAHHMMPIYGNAYIGIVPSPHGRIIGLSKYDRIVDHFSARLQIQEELVQQIGRYIQDATSPNGLAVRISAVHMCKTHRGVRASGLSRMVTNAWFGHMKGDAALRQEFLQECSNLDCTS